MFKNLLVSIDDVVVVELAKYLLFSWRLSTGLFRRCLIFVSGSPNIDRIQFPRSGSFFSHNLIVDHPLTGLFVFLCTQLWFSEILHGPLDSCQLDLPVMRKWHLSDIAWRY